MASTQIFKINGILFAVTVGAGDIDGVTIYPSEVVNHSDEEIMKGVRLLTKHYSEIRDYAFISEFYLSNRSYDASELNSAPHKNLERIIQQCKNVINSTFLELEDWELETLSSLAHDSRMIIEGYRFGKPKMDKSHRIQKGYVYLIRAIEPHSHYKIGLSKTPVKRIESLDVKLPFPIEVIHLIKTDDMRGLEKSLHSKYAEKRINGEWFALSDDDVREICSMSSMNGDE